MFTRTDARRILAMAAISACCLSGFSPAAANPLPNKPFTCDSAIPDRAQTARILDHYGIAEGRMTAFIDENRRRRDGGPVRLGDAIRSLPGLHRVETLSRRPSVYLVVSMDDADKYDRIISDINLVLRNAGVVYRKRSDNNYNDYNIFVSIHPLRVRVGSTPAFSRFLERNTTNETEFRARLETTQFALETRDDAVHSWFGDNRGFVNAGFFFVDQWSAEARDMLVAFLFQVIHPAIASEIQMKIAESLLSIDPDRTLENPDDVTVTLFGSALLSHNVFRIDDFLTGHSVSEIYAELVENFDTCETLTFATLYQWGFAPKTTPEHDRAARAAHVRRVLNDEWFLDRLHREGIVPASGE